MSQDDHDHHLPTLQAPVKALDPHGVQIVGLGTMLFAIGTVICWWQLPLLSGTGKEWWFSTALVGTGIGVLALAVLLVLRRRRLR
ncbi:DUF2530 domain-containing protein [Micropruina sonneratiae]|uniref:DUF2530 domain-containing protein n=1 Tax=Micropruina sonneratiae TaxID=2986940 RepID=UPI00222708FF|nr:DUF2530 domain-containing protein [Micropruina sp. KQZ13P-5]MCW3158914.1 DUF2530 domain-containing protein [Micropruina sp. KQZ13P-5]